MELTDREIAILFWLFASTSFTIIHPKIRPSTLGVVKAFGHITILIPFALLYLYLGMVIWGLSTIGLWGWDQLKNTFVWSITAGAISLFRLPKIEDSHHFFREWLRDTLHIFVVVEFVVNFHSLPLVAELILQPVMFVIFGMIAVGAREPKHARVVRLLNGLTITFGVFLVGNAAYGIWTNFDGFARIATLRDFYTPIVLSILFSPFIFVLHVYSAYENASLGLKWVIKDNRLRRYAGLRAAFAFGARTRLLRRWQRYLGTNHPETREDIHKSIRSVLSAYRREKSPTPVPAVRGWSPQIAIGLLADEGVRASDYHKSFDDSWTASSAMVEIGDGMPADNIAYYVEGDEIVATRLSLQINVYNPRAQKSSMQRYVEIGAKLLQRAVGSADFDITKPMQVSLPLHSITVERVDWTGSIHGYDLTLTIKINETLVADQNGPLARVDYHFQQS
jgi:hypothetical protein